MHNEKPPAMPGHATTNPSTTTTPAGRTVSPKPSDFVQGDVRFINELFHQLRGIFPAWRTAITTDAELAEAKRQWAAGLIEARITSPDAISAGLKKARSSTNPFIPSVGMFIGWCHEAMRERLAFPALDTVIRQIVDYRHHRQYRSSLAPEIHPVAYWIYQRIDAYALSRAESPREARRLVDPWYVQAQQMAASGGPFEAPPALIPEDIGKGAPSTPEQIQAREEARLAVKRLLKHAGD